MALSKEITHSFELLFNELLSRKEAFWTTLAKMEPVIHYRNEFFVAFFLGYLAHSYKQLFFMLTNRDMQYEEINETLEFLVRKEPEIREFLVGEWVPKKQIADIQQEEESIKPVKVDVERADIQQEESIKPVKVDVERVNILEFDIEEIRKDINIIKRAAKNEIAKYEVKLAKRGEFKKSIFEQ